MRLFSPAKINIFLRVLSRRPDGYHNLSTLMQTIDLGDILTFSESKVDQITCSDPSLPIDQRNLVVKALTLFRSKTGVVFPVHIHLEKYIPQQAGLGGASSNAATTLWALNELSGRRVGEEELTKWAALIGSDVPFFFSQGTALCTGKGEVIQNLSPSPFIRGFALFKPPRGLATPMIYRGVDLEASSRVEPDRLLESYYSGAARFVNDLEAPAFHIFPRLKEYKENLLAAGYDKVFMTGSGSVLVSPIDPLNPSPRGKIDEEILRIRRGEEEIFRPIGRKEWFFG